MTSVVIMAAGRDFHNFNVVFRNVRSTRVVAFTATQIAVALTGDECGVGVVTRAMRERFPFVKVP